MRVGSCPMIPGPGGDVQTYHMDNKTVLALHAAGSVTRVFDDHGHRYEVVVINSDRGESFHDPAGCFTAQEWTVDELAERSAPTSMGPIQVNSLFISKQGVARLPAAYVFKHGSAFVADQGVFLRRLFLGELTTATRQEGYMYRFISESEGTSMDDLLSFVGRYLDASRAL